MLAQSRPFHLLVSCGHFFSRLVPQTKWLPTHTVGSDFMVWLVWPLLIGHFLAGGSMLMLDPFKPPPQEWNQSDGPSFKKILGVWERQYFSIANSTLVLPRLTKIPSACFSTSNASIAKAFFSATANTVGHQRGHQNSQMKEAQGLLCATPFVRKLALTFSLKKLS